MAQHQLRPARGSDGRRAGEATAADERDAIISVVDLACASLETRGTCGTRLDAVFCLESAGFGCD